MVGFWQKMGKPYAQKGKKRIPDFNKLKTS